MISLPHYYQQAVDNLHQVPLNDYQIRLLKKADRHYFIKEHCKILIIVGSIDLVARLAINLNPLPTLICNSLLLYLWKKSSSVFTPQLKNIVKSIIEERYPLNKSQEKEDFF